MDFQEKKFLVSKYISLSVKNINLLTRKVMFLEVSRGEFKMCPNFPLGKVWKRRVLNWKWYGIKMD